MTMQSVLLYPDFWVLQTYVCGAFGIVDGFVKL